MQFRFAIVWGFILGVVAITNLTIAAEVPQGTFDDSGKTFTVTPMTEPQPLPQEQFRAVKCLELTGADGLALWTDGAGQPVKNWELKDGILHPTGKKAKDIFVKGEYQFFVLDFEFEVPHEGNSGVYYLGWADDKLKANGYEYQIIDDVNRKVHSTLERYGTAGLYTMYHRMYAVGPGVHKGFNTGRILVMGNHIEHWLNGKMAISVQTGTSNWRDHLASSRFSVEPKFGHKTSGRIALQYHNYDVRFRNIRLTVFEKVK